MKQKIETAYEYKATIVKWVDGDTCDVEKSDARPVSYQPEPPAAVRAKFLKNN